MYPKIIGVRDAGVYLVQVSEDRGFVYDGPRNVKSRDMDLDAIIKFGYWEPYEGALTVEDLDLEGARESK